MDRQPLMQVTGRVSATSKGADQGDFGMGVGVGIASEQMDRQSDMALAHGAQTPSYKVLLDANLLTFEHKKESFRDLFDPSQGDLQANSSSSANLATRLAWGYHCGCCCIYNMTHHEITVEAGEVGLLVDDSNRYLWAEPGMHNIFSLYTHVVGRPRKVDTSGAIEHGNRTIVTVDQGTLGFCMDQGQPVLLPPGLHSWTSETMRFKGAYNLEDHVIQVGPYTILTVDEGYAAITQNNGKQMVLEGGKTHLLTHQKWRFEKFITLKIQTDDLEKIEAASADNIIMRVNSTVVWRIVNVQTAATMAAETMAATGRDGDVTADIVKLRRDVLKQAIASLASFIGSVNYSDSFHVAAAAQRTAEQPLPAMATPADVLGTEPFVQEPPTASRGAENPMFDQMGMSEAVNHANVITMTYGVEICSINIISANPVDKNLMNSLASGAVAAAEALQSETAARGNAKAVRIEAEAMAATRRIEAGSIAEAELVKARADAEAEVTRAEGSKKAADLIGESDVAVALAKIDRSAAALSKGDKMYFGQEPAYMQVSQRRGLDLGLGLGPEPGLRLVSTGLYSGRRQRT
mmetsp:Transcript_93912/g.268941  ORF Transcript_93912/g.268941 Transcript_93912/m.268941 type:complete len:577 (-) Transcript_93912:7-1737(-)